MKPCEGFLIGAEAYEVNPRQLGVARHAMRSYVFLMTLRQIVHQGILHL
jgi:hypothetical protein